MLEITKLKKNYIMIIDQERCIGCEACTVACSKENDCGAGWIRVVTQNSPCKDTPAGTYPEVTMQFLPILCNHCDQPPCEDVCPVAAITKLDSGVVILAEDQCDGCQACLEACPFGAIQFNQKKDKAGKCNLCNHRIEKKLEPFCVICCEGQAIDFGDLNDPGSKVSKLLQTNESFQLKPHKETGPAVYYLPPKHPRGL